MRLKTLSASSALVYEECPARWAAEMRDRIPQIGNSAASLGTACHNAFDEFVKQGWHLKSDGEQEHVLRQLFNYFYDQEFTDDSRRAEGWEMCLRWQKRTRWDDRQVLSAEEKKYFNIGLSDGGMVPFNYIMDRKDLIVSTGEIEVVDYKSLMRPMSAQTLASKIQARAYGLAAQKEHPDAERIWVTFDMLRYDPISVSFTKEQNRQTWTYLQRLAERIIADQTAEERLGHGCRWCSRAHVCKTLKKHVDLEGILSMDDIDVVAAALLDVQSQRAGLEALENRLGDQVATLMERDQMIDYEGTEVTVRFAARGRRHVDAQQLRAAVGDKVFGDFGGAKMASVDAMLASPDIDPSVKEKIKACIQKDYADPKPVVEKANPVN